LAGKAYLRREPYIDPGASLDAKLHTQKDFSRIKSAMAVPLARNGLSNYGSIALYSEKANAFNAESAKLFDAIASRISQLFLNSFALERNLASANTDALTKLPNERAFFVVLENRVAESIRYNERRPLSLLCLDIVGFSDLNRRFGYATGDRALIFVAERLRQLLRRMDFVARIVGDEFFIVLPTANEQTTNEIIQRITNVFAHDSFEASPTENIKLKLHYGRATLFDDGRTSGEILKAANMRRLQRKMPPGQVVVEFPRPHAG
jgi:diguanylate cyclase (GGDEF)-like protein